MSKGNPLRRPFSEELSSEDVIFLNALNDSSTLILNAADRLRDIGAHANAEALEVIAEQIIEQLEQGLEEATEFDPTEFGEPEDEEFSTLDEDYAAIYADYLARLAGDPPLSSRGNECFATQRRFADLLRDVPSHYGLFVRKDVTDEQLIEAAKDAYEARKSYRERYR